MRYETSFKTFPIARYALDESDLDESNCLGSGTSGVVARAVDTRTGRAVALKVQARAKRVLRQQRREHLIHGALSAHPNVVTLIDTYITPEHVVSAMHLSLGGDLMTAVNEGAFHVRVDKLRAGFLQLTSALAHMHALGLYHRDLKLENVLVSRDRRTWQLCDFGLAVDREVTQEAGLGSAYYRAPEVLKGRHNNREADIYALGMVFLMAVGHTYPWRHARRSDVDFRSYLTHGVAHLQAVTNVSESFGEFCSWFLTPDPADRISLDEAAQELKALDLTMLLPLKFFEELCVSSPASEKQQSEMLQPSAVPSLQPSAVPSLQSSTMPSLVRTSSSDTSSTSSAGRPATPPSAPPPIQRDDKLAITPAQPMLSSTHPMLSSAHPMLSSAQSMLSSAQPMPSSTSLYTSYSRSPLSIAPRQKMGFRERLGASLRRALHRR